MHYSLFYTFCWQISLSISFVLFLLSLSLCLYFCVFKLFKNFILNVFKIRYNRVLSRTDSNLSLTNLRPKSHSRSLPNLNSCGIAPRQNNYRQIGRSMHQIPGRPTRHEQSTPKPVRYGHTRRSYPSKQGQLLSPSIVTTDVDWTKVSLAEVLSLIPVTKSQAILFKYGCHHTRR